MSKESNESNSSRSDITHGLVPNPRDWYPPPKEVDGFCEEVMEEAEAGDLAGERLEDGVWDFRVGVRHTAAGYLAFRSQALGGFYGIWQPAPSGRGPLLVHVPGYGSEMSVHPELVAEGYNVLHVNPLGYATPSGPDESKRPQGQWPVLPETARSLGRSGYRQWLTQAAAATLWALRQEQVSADRYAFFGSSQGGGGALLLASLFRDRGVRCVAADVAFLTDFPMVWQMAEHGAYQIAFGAIEQLAENHPDDVPTAWRALGLIDTISHVQRLTMPVLLTVGAQDAACPAQSVEALFDHLPGTRSYTNIAGQGHAYTPAFLHLARAWFRLYV